jgi:protein-tyrosine phosphatase
MTTEMRQPGANIPIPSLLNLRDLGGWPTRDGGRVRWGLVYRSTDLSKLQGDGLAAFARLGIRSVYDLRTEAERTKQPDHVPAGTEQIMVDVLAGSPDAAPAKVMHALTDPDHGQKLLGGDRAVALFGHGYREFVSLPSASAAYRRLFSDLARAEHRPALFHCTTGKDRAGWGAAALLLLLDVPDDLVMQEYLLTNSQLVPALQPLFDRFAAQGGDREIMLNILGVRAGYLEASLDEMRIRYGTIERYFADGLGIDASAQQTLRDVFVERDTTRTTAPTRSARCTVPGSTLPAARSRRPSSTWPTTPTSMSSATSKPP